MNALLSNSPRFSLRIIMLTLCSVAFLSACNNEEDSSANPMSANNTTQTTTILPDNASEVGTTIQSVADSKTDEETKPKANQQPKIDENGFRELSWDELSPEGYEQNKILDKYQPLIEATPEGSPDENEIFDKMMAELNSAPANEKLAGEKIRIPGFVSPLDEADGKVTEFLLVPYFGACIHVPPPPLNNTLLIKPKASDAIPLEQSYEPVWVIGEMQVKTTSTDLAEAGYLIESAAIEIYDVDAEEAKQAAESQDAGN
jgi:hypothetical protein